MTPTYDPDRSALLLVDPYNDFLHADGKLWPLVADTAKAVGLHANLRSAIAAARATGLCVFIVPHHQSEPGDFDCWDHPTPYQLGAAQQQVFARGSWGAQWHTDFAPHPTDIIVKEHWGSSGFANTCIETTGKFASELGYHVTLVSDATAAASAEALHCAHAINGPTYAHAILTTDELVAALPAYQDA